MENNQLATIHMPDIQAFCQQAQGKAWKFQVAQHSQLYSHYFVVLSGFTEERIPIKLTVDCGETIRHDEPRRLLIQKRVDRVVEAFQKELDAAGLQVLEGLLDNAGARIIGTFPKLEAVKVESTQNEA